MIGYYNMDGEPIEQDEALKLLDSNERIVAKNNIGDVEISTVLLVINHQFGDGPPLIFETMIFGGELDGETYRYSTKALAEAGHAHAVNLVSLEKGLK